jgi:predicted DNA-binding transcriptional regulator AlpA
VPTTTAEPPERLLVTGTPWVICGISRAMWFRLKKQGKTPPPVDLSDTTRDRIWRVEDLRAWVRSLPTRPPGKGVAHAA